MNLEAMYKMSFAELYGILVNFRNEYEEDLEALKSAERVKVGLTGWLRFMFKQKYDFEKHKVVKLKIIELSDREWFNLTTIDKEEDWAGYYIIFRKRTDYLEKINKVIAYWNEVVVNNYGCSEFISDRNGLIADLIKLGLTDYCNSMASNDLVRDVFKTILKEKI